MQGGLKLRIDPPPKFNGTNFEEFNKKLRNYMCLSNLRYAELMRWAVTKDRPIDEQLMTEQDVDENLQASDTTIRLSALFYYVLAGLVEGPAYTIVDQVSDANGLEAWRLLHHRFAKTKLQQAIMRLVTIVTTIFQDNSFETTFAEWENDIVKLEESVGKQLHGEIKIGLLIA